MRFWFWIQPRRCTDRISGVAQRTWGGRRRPHRRREQVGSGVGEGRNTAERGRKAVTERVPFFKHVPFVYIVGGDGLRVRKLLDLIVEVGEVRNRRVETSEVNRVLERLTQRTQPPQAVGKEVKLLYASQIGTAPPTFAIVANRPEAIPESYQRYLVNGFYKEWASWVRRSV